MRSPIPLLLLGLPLSLVWGCDNAAAPPTSTQAPVAAEVPQAATTAEVAKAPEPTAAPAEPEAAVAEPAATAEATAAPKAPVAEPANRLAQGGAEKPAAAPEETKGAEVADASYGAWLQAGSKFTAGEPAAVTAVLTARGGFKCNDKYPYKFTLDPAPSGVTYPSTVVTGMAVSDARSTMSIPFTPTDKGAKTISGTLAFSVCDADKCLIEKQKLSVTVNVM